MTEEINDIEENNDWLQDSLSDITASLVANSNNDESGEEVKDKEEEIVEDDSKDEVEETETIEETEESKEEVKEEETEEEEEFTPTEYGQTIQTLIDNDVLEFNDEKEYEDSPEGVKELFLDNVEKKSEEKLEAYKESVGENGQEFLDFVSKGGTIDEFIEFKKEIDYSKYGVENADGDDLVDNQKAFISDMLLAKGNSKEEIDEMIEFYESKGKLKDVAIKAKDTLIKNQETKREELLKSKEEAKIQEEEALAASAEEFKSKVLETKEIKGFKVSKKDANDLYDFMTKPIDKEGNTAFKKADSEEARMLLAFLAMKGFNKESLAKEERRKATVKLKKSLTKPIDSRANMRTSSTGTQSDSSLKASDILKKWGAFED